MRQRRETVEHPFGTIKARMGATHFLMKTLPRVASEMALHVLAYNLTRVMNTRTAGAVLAASMFLMGNGDLLLLAVADVTVDGQRLEGVGVTPTIEVPFDPVYAAGRDPQLDRAVQVLSDRIKG